MADFCKQCSEEIFGEDFEDLKGLGNGRKLKPLDGWVTICEGCGPTIVNEKGECISSRCLKKHGANNVQST